MEIKELNKEGLKVSYSVSVSSSELQEEKNKKLAKIGAGLTIDGFRKGNAPLSTVEAKYGPKVIRETLDEVTNQSIDKLYKENKLETVSSPKVNVKSFSMEDGLELSVEIELFPEIKEIDLSTITINKNVVDISDKEIDQSLEQMSTYYKTFEDVTESRESQNGDVVVIDFVGSIDGVEFEGGKGNDFPLELDSKTFIPGFEEQLVGAKVGDNVIVNVTFPEDYNAPHLAGKEAEFKVSINKLQKSTNAKIDDELAKKVGFQTLNEVKEDIRARYEKHTSLLEKNTLRKQLMEELDKLVEMEYPPSLLEAEEQAMWRQFSSFKEHMKKLEEKGDLIENEQNKKDIEYYRKSDDEIKQENAIEAKKRIKIALFFNDIAKKNAIRLEQVDIKNTIENEALLSGKHPSALEEHYKKDSKAMSDLRNRALEDKIMSFILSKIKYNETKVSFEDYVNTFSK